MAGINEMLVDISGKVGKTDAKVDHIIVEQNSIKTAMFGVDGNGGMMSAINEATHNLKNITSEHKACMDDKAKDKKIIQELKAFKDAHDQDTATRAARIKAITMMLSKGGITATGIITVMVWLWDRVAVPIGRVLKHLFS